MKSYLNAFINHAMMCSDRDNSCILIGIQSSVHCNPKPTTIDDQVYYHLDYSQGFVSEGDSLGLLLTNSMQ